MTGVQIKRLQPQDLDQFMGLINVFEEVFEMDNFIMPDRDYLEKFLHRDSFLTYIALFDGQVIGGLTAYVLPSYYIQSSEVYIYDLAVKPPFQRKGTGRRLLESIQADCRLHGWKEVFVQADKADQHAIDFYRSTGGCAEEVTHFSYPLQNP